MNKFEKFIRFSPRLFLIAAVVDLVKQLLWLLPFWLHYHNQVLTTADYGYQDGRMTVEFFDRLLSVFLYPLGWIATAIVVTLLLSIYDARKRASEAAE